MFEEVFRFVGQKLDDGIGDLVDFGDRVAEAIVSGARSAFSACRELGGGVATAGDCAVEAVSSRTKSAYEKCAEAIEDVSEAVNRGVKRVARKVSNMGTGKKILIVVGLASVCLIGGVAIAPAIGMSLSALGIGVGAPLYGAAASSSALAALGGGSLAAGGCGVAGGTLVVGAIACALGTVTGTATFAAARSLA